MTLQIYNIKRPLSSILINIFTQRVQFIDIEIGNELGVGGVSRCHIVTLSRGGGAVTGVTGVTISN